MPTDYKRQNLRLTEPEVIAYVENMQPLDKLHYYMMFWINCYPNNYNTFEQFCDKSNIQINDTGIDDWKERGFASRTWVVLRAGSIYHSVHHNIQ